MTELSSQPQGNQHYLTPSGRVFECPVCQQREEPPAGILAVAPKGPLCYGPKVAGPDGWYIDDHPDAHAIVAMVELPTGPWYCRTCMWEGFPEVDENRAPYCGGCASYSVESTAVTA
jgi:hypothetical protein